MENTKIISIITEKGGTGKTTTTFNLGCSLGKLGKRVLLAEDNELNAEISMTVLKENGLKVLEEVCPLSARMVVNQVSMKMENERILKIINDLRNYVEAK